MRFLSPTDGPLQVDIKGFHEGPLVIEDVKLRPTGRGQTALKIVCPTAESVVEPSVVLRNVIVMPGFAVGIELVNCWMARLEGVNIYGAYDGDLQTAILLKGQSTDVKIDKADIAHAETGILIEDVCEGTRVLNSSILACVHGICASSSTPGRPWLVVADTHISASRACVVAINRRQVSVHDNLFYPHGRHDPGLGWTPTAYINCTEVEEHHNMVDATPLTI